jgi:lipopolysaccharide export system permease protein
MLIFRALAKEILGYTLAIMVIFMAVIVISRFLYFLNHAAMGMISMSDLCKMMVIIVSLFSVHVLLLSFYLAMIFVLSRYFSEHEMTALFASGFSRMHLMGYMMLLTLGMSILISGMVFWLEPMATYSQDVVLAQAITSAQISKILPGRFETLDNGNKMVYATTRKHENGQMVLQDVLLVQHTPSSDKSKETWDISTAMQARQQSVAGTQTPFIVLDHGHRAGFTQGSLALDRMAFDQYGVGIFTSKPTISVPVEGLPTLYLLAHYRDSQQNLSALHYRLSIVLSLFLLTIIAVPLSYVAPRRGRYVKLMPALLIYLIYMGLLLSNKSWIAHATAHVWLYLCWLQLILLFIGFILFRYGMGPLTNRYRHRLKKVFMPWRMIKVRSNARL